MEIEEVTNKLFLKNNIHNLLNDKIYEYSDLLLKWNKIVTKWHALKNINLTFLHSSSSAQLKERRDGHSLEAIDQQDDNVNIESSVLTSLINLLTNSEYNYYNVKIEDHTDYTVLRRYCHNNNWTGVKRDFHLGHRNSL